MTTRGVPSVRLSTPSDVLASVPYLLGFHPADSLVLVSLRGPRAWIGLTMRLDLPFPDEAAAAADVVTRHLVRDGADGALVVAYGSSDAWDSSAGRQVTVAAEACVEALRRRGIAVRDALLVGPTRFRSALCADDRCCPSAGTPLPDTADSPLAATAVAQGRAVLPSRESALQVLQAPSADEVGTVRQYIAEATTALDARLAGGETGEDLAAESLQQFDAAAGRLAQDPCAALDDRRVARLAAAVRDVEVRDAVALGATGEQGVRVQHLLRSLLARVPSPEDVPLAACLGLLAYLRGDGVLARMALDRALTGDPRYRLAVMLSTALDEGVPPSALAEARTRVRIGAHRDSLTTKIRTSG